MNTNKVYENKDLKDQHLENKDMSSSIFHRCDGRYMDLRGKDLTDSTFPETDMSHCKWLGAKITLNCHTFERMKIDLMTAHMYMYLLTLTDMPEVLKNKIINDIMGQTLYNKLKEFFDKTER